MKASRSLRHSTSTTALIRRNLGLTQKELAGYLNVLPERVSDAEAGRRALTMQGKANVREAYLWALLPAAAFEAANVPQLTLEPPVAGTLLPVPAPPLPLSDKMREEIAWQHQVRDVEALQLRFALSKRLARAQWQAHIRQMRQAVLAAFADPPPAARAFRAQVPDDDPQTTADFQNLLAILLRRSARAADGPFDPATLARDQLRLYLLEAEAATLAAWLAAAPEPPAN